MKEKRTLDEVYNDLSCYRNSNLSYQSWSLNLTQLTKPFLKHLFQAAWHYAFQFYSCSGFSNLGFSISSSLTLSMLNLSEHGSFFPTLSKGDVIMALQADKPLFYTGLQSCIRNLWRQVLEFKYWVKKKRYYYHIFDNTTSKMCSGICLSNTLIFLN